MSHLTCQPKTVQKNILNESFFNDPFFYNIKRASTVSVPVDIINKREKVVLAIDLPGYSKESLSIEVENGVLRLSGERKAVELGEGESYYLRERPFAKFAREFKLGDSLDGEAIQAEFHNGVLAIEIPRKEKAQTRKVEIK